MLRSFMVKPAGFLAIVLSSQVCSSAPIADDFNDGDDNGWTRVAPLEPYGSPSFYSFPQGQYSFQVAASQNPRMVGPARIGSLREDLSSADFDLSVDLTNLAQSPIDTDLGLIARVTNVGLGTTDGYGFLYDRGGSFSIVVFDHEQDSLVAEGFITLSDTSSYRLRFTGRGTDFTGTVVDLAHPGTVIFSLSGTDPSHQQAGICGLLVYDDSLNADQPAAGTFDNFFVTVPEPSAVALASLGALAFCAIRRTRFLSALS